MPRKYSRRRRSSKLSTKRRKSKKMRGGVTVRAQDLKTRLPEDMFWEIREMHPLLTPKLTNATIRRAVRDYLNGGARKQRVVTKYGDISNWDVSNVTDMTQMFDAARSFCPVPLTVRGTQALVSFAPLAFKLFYAARQNAVLRRSPFPSP